MTCPITNPTSSPLPYPIITTFQLNPSPKDDSWLGQKVGASIFSHFLDNGNPQNLKFSLNEEFWNVPNCPPWGIRPFFREFQPITFALDDNTLSSY